MRYELQHPNGVVFVTEAESKEVAIEKVVAELHEDAVCDPDEFVVTEVSDEHSQETPS